MRIFQTISAVKPVLACACRPAVAKAKAQLTDQTGAGTVEYALLIAVIVIGIVGIASAMIPELGKIFQDIVEAVRDLAGV